jgi:hypothetical protein
MPFYTKNYVYVTMRNWNSPISLLRCFLELRSPNLNSNINTSLKEQSSWVPVTLFICRLLHRKFILSTYFVAFLWQIMTKDYDIKFCPFTVMLLRNMKNMLHFPERYGSMYYSDAQMSLWGKHKIESVFVERTFVHLYNSFRFIEETIRWKGKQLIS